MSKTNIAKIIEACGNHNVKKITFDGVEIEFFGASSQYDVFEEAEKYPTIIQDFESDDIQTFEKEDETRLTDEEFAHLMVEDPAKFEEMLANDKLDSYGEPDA